MSRARPGLAVERTVLAWTRTWLSTGVCGLLLVRLTVGSPLRTVAALLVGAAAVVASTAAGRRRANRLRAAASAAEVDPGTRAAAVTATTATVLGVAAAVLVTLH